MMPSPPKRITIHCSATQNGKHASVEAMERDHIGRGFDKLGYHYVIQPDGEKIGYPIGRALNEVGAHVEGANVGNIGICLIGDTKFTIAQFKTLRELLDDLCRYNMIEKHEIRCHYQYPSAIRQGKTCPNMEINKLLVWFLGGYDNAISEYVLQETTLGLR